MISLGFQTQLNTRSKDRREIDHFQLPKFSSTINSYSRNFSQTTKPKKKSSMIKGPNTMTLSSIYSNMKISREYHTNTQRNNSFYNKKNNKMMRKTKSKVSLFETLGNFKSNGNSRTTSRYRSEHKRKKENLNFRIKSNLHSESQYLDRIDGNYQSKNNNFMDNSLMKKYHKKNKKYLIKSPFIINTSSTDNIFQSVDSSSRGNIGQTIMMRTRSQNKKSGGIKENENLINPKNIKAKSWVIILLK